MSDKKLRELDAWIAINLFGFIWAKDTAEDWQRSGGGFKKGTRCLRDKLWKDQGWIKSNGKEPISPRWDHDVEHYSTDPAAAMQVLEKCAEHLAGGVYIRKGKRGDWSVCKYEDIEPRWATAPTLPLAIAQFARQLFPESGRHWPKRKLRENDLVSPPNNMMNELIKMAEKMDWQQVALNGGPPCFHSDGKCFCGRALRWEGHPEDHKFVSLADLIRELQKTLAELLGPTIEFLEKYQTDRTSVGSASWILFDQELTRLRAICASVEGKQ